MSSNESDVEERPAALSRKPEYSIVPPDGGWGWFVAIGAFITTLLVPVNFHVFSLLYVKLFSDNNTSTSSISWIFNLSQVSFNFFSIFVPTLCVQFGFRRVTISGGLLLGISYIISSFLEDAQILFLTFSIIAGIGSSLGLNCWSFVTPPYFEKRRGRVIGFLTCGLCSGQFVAPILVKKLQDYCGHRGTLLIMGGIFLNICISGALYHPVEWHAKKTLVNPARGEVSHDVECTSLTENRRKTFQRQHSYTRKLSYDPNAAGTSLIYGILMSLPTFSNDLSETATQHIEMTNALVKEEHSPSPKKQSMKCCEIITSILKGTLNDISLIKHTRVAFFALSISLVLLFYINFLMLIPLAVVDKGFSMEIAAYAITILGIANVFIRIVVSILSDILRVSPRWYYFFGCLTAVASIFAFGSAKHEKEIYIAVAFYGIGVGSCITTYVLIFIELVGVKLLPSTLGVNGILALVLSPTLGPTLGYIRDLSEDYYLCLLVLASLHFVPLLLCALLPLATKFDQKRKLTEKKGQNDYE